MVGKVQKEAADRRSRKEERLVRDAGYKWCGQKCNLGVSKGSAVPVQLSFAKEERAVQCSVVQRSAQMPSGGFRNERCEFEGVPPVESDVRPTSLSIADPEALTQKHDRPLTRLLRLC